MRTRNWIIFIIVSFLAGGLVASIFFARSNRRQSQQVAELQQRNAEFERQYLDSNRRLNGVSDILTDYSRRTAALAGTMAEQLADDRDDLERTRTLVKLLREQIKVLEDSYSDISRIVISDDSNISSEIKEE